MFRYTPEDVGLARKDRFYIPRIEILEDRTVPAVLASTPAIVAGTPVATETAANTSINNIAWAGLGTTVVAETLRSISNDFVTMNDAATLAAFQD